MGMVTCVNDVAAMSEIQRQDERDGEPPHDGVWKLALKELGAEAAKRFAHELQNVGTVRALMHEIIYQVADICMANLFIVSSSQIS